MRSRRLLPIVAVCCAGCGALPFPDDEPVPDAVDEFFSGMAGAGGPFACAVIVEDAFRAASAPDPHGGADYSWWIAPTDGGGRADVILQVDGNGVEVGGAGGGCGNGPDPREDDELWWSGGGGSDREVAHGGHAPDGATHVRLTFGQHEPVVTEVQTGGYFLVVIGESACCEWSFPTRLEALDADGAVIASISP